MIALTLLLSLSSSPAVTQERANSADSLRYVADSLRAIAGATTAAETMESIPTDPVAVAHCPEYVAVALDLDARADSLDLSENATDWKSSCGRTKSLTSEE
jgi:hypothetical protein